MPSTGSFLIAICLIGCIATIEASSSNGSISIQAKIVGRSPNRAKRAETETTTLKFESTTPQLTASNQTTTVAAILYKDTSEGTQKPTEGDECQKCLAMHGTYTKSKDYDAEYIAWCTAGKSYTADVCRDFLAAMRQTASDGVSANNFCRILQRC